MARYSAEKERVALVIASHAAPIVALACNSNDATARDLANEVSDALKFLAQWGRTTTESDRRQIFARLYLVGRYAKDCKTPALRRAFADYSRALHLLTHDNEYGKAVIAAVDASNATRT